MDSHSELSVARQPRPEPESAAELFRSLADRWHRETIYLSLMSKSEAHPAYRQIIEHAKAAPETWLPMILRDLEASSRHWYAALKAVTGGWPADPDDRGKLARIRAAWLAWGRERNLL